MYIYCKCGSNSTRKARKRFLATPPRCCDLTAFLDAPPNALSPQRLLYGLPRPPKL